MKQIPVATTFALVDDEDYALVSVYKWTLHSDGYAVHKYGPKHRRRHIFMHRLIMNASPGKVVDHKDENNPDNRLDNRRHNLRIATHSQNHGNSSFKPGTTSCYRGVAWHTAAGKWRARIAKGDGGDVHLGLFTSEEDAARAYDAAAKAYFGEFANLNFPEIKR